MVCNVGLVISVRLGAQVENAVPSCFFTTGVFSSPILMVKAARDQVVLMRATS
jgi:hypothetical protein